MIQVKLKKDALFIASKIDPKIGSRFETIGTLFKIVLYDNNNNNKIEIFLNNIKQLYDILNNHNYYYYYVHVRWDNSITTIYELEDLVILNDMNYKSIW